MYVRKIIEIQFEYSHKTNSHRTELSLLEEELHIAFPKDTGDKDFLFNVLFPDSIKADPPVIRLGLGQIDGVYEVLNKNTKINNKNTPVLFDLFLEVQLHTTLI
jgi:hypothetical protein